MQDWQLAWPAWPWALAGGVDGGANRERCLNFGKTDHTSPKFDTDMLISLLRQENARDSCVIKVPPETKYTDYFVTRSGISTCHGLPTSL